MLFHIAMLKIMMEEKKLDVKLHLWKFLRRDKEMGSWRRIWILKLADWFCSEPARTPKNQFSAHYTELKVCVPLLCTGCFRKPWGCKVMLAPWEGASSSWAPEQQHCWKWAALLHPDVFNLSGWVFLCGFSLCKSLRDFHSQGISAVPKSRAALHCNKEMQCSGSKEMPNADLHHIPEPGTSFLAASAPSRSSPCCLSSPQDWNPPPVPFPVGFPQVFEEQELFRRWTMVTSEGWNPAQQPGGWPGRMGASSICEQTPPVSSPCLTTLTKSWPQINPTPCGIQGLPHASSRKGKFPPQMEAEPSACAAGLAL